MNQVPVPTPVPHPASKIMDVLFWVFDQYRSYKAAATQRQLYPGGGLSKSGSGGKGGCIVKPLNGRSYILREFHPPDISKTATKK